MYNCSNQLEQLSHWKMTYKFDCNNVCMNEWSRKLIMMMIAKSRPQSRLTIKTFNSTQLRQLIKVIHCGGDYINIRSQLLIAMIFKLKQTVNAQLNAAVLPLIQTLNMSITPQQLKGACTTCNNDCKCWWCITQSMSQKGTQWSCWWLQLLFFIVMMVAMITHTGGRIQQVQTDSTFNLTGFQILK